MESWCQQERLCTAGTVLQGIGVCAFYGEVFSSLVNLFVKILEMNGVIALYSITSHWRDLDLARNCVMLAA